MWSRNCSNIHLIKLMGEEVLVLRLDFCLLQLAYEELERPEKGLLC